MVVTITATAQETIQNFDINEQGNEATVETGQDTLGLPIFFEDSTVAIDTLYFDEEDLSPHNSLPLVVDSSNFYTDTIIKWLTFEEGIALQQKSNAKLLVHVFAPWCRWCKAMDTVFVNKEIAHYLNQQFIPVKFNAETKTAVNYRGKTYKFLPNMDDFVHELTLLLLNDKQNYPGFVVFDETGATVNITNGYMDAIRFENYINYHGSNAYRHSSFDSFNEDFHGRVK